MKAFLIALLFLIFITFVVFISSAHAQVKCESDGRGGMCCWDMRTQGPFKPIGC